MSTIAGPSYTGQLLVAAAGPQQVLLLAAVAVVHYCKTTSSIQQLVWRAWTADGCSSIGWGNADDRLNRQSCWIGSLHDSTDHYYMHYSCDASQVPQGAGNTVLGCSELGQVPQHDTCS